MTLPQVNNNPNIVKDTLLVVETNIIIIYLYKKL